MRSSDSILFLLLVVVFLFFFAAMLLTFLAAIDVLRGLGSTCRASPRLCEVYSAAWRGAAAILIFTAIALLLAFIISLIVLFIESVLRG